MATIVRGHNFGINDLVFAQDLHDLVRNAQITGLGLSDLSDGTVVTISVHTAPTTPPMGWITAKYESSFQSTHVSYTEFNYLIRGRCGDVALFKPLGLEQRMVFQQQTPVEAGRAFLIEPLASPGVTLEGDTDFTAITDAHFSYLGSTYGTTTTSSSEGMPRTVLKGLCDVDITNNTSSATDRQYLRVVSTTTTGRFQSSGASYSQRAGAMLMDQRLREVAPGFMFGGINFRSLV